MDVRRVWGWLLGPRPFKYGGRCFSTEADMQRAVWKDALRP